MKHMKMLLAVLLCGLLALACGACGENECAHVYGEWKTVVQVSCLVDGTLERFCTKCGQVETTTVPATGHRFGNWVDGNGVRTRQCSICGYTETMQQGGGTQGGNQGQGGTQGGGTVDAVTAVYGSLDLYLADCSVSSNDYYYHGESTRFSVNIGQGTAKPDGRTFYIPENVNYVKFIGRTQGDPFYNTKFVVQTRASDLTVEFQDVNIESNESLFRSETRNINLSLTMSGTLCRFIVTQKGYRGYDGEGSGGWFDKLPSGGDGGSGNDAFFVNGTCTLYCKANQVIIQAGEGGDGGTGGPAWGMNGNASGNGGNGGRGGDAFTGERLVKVEVSQGCTVSITGGAGGAAGSAGTSDKGNRGSDGSVGSSGASGCIEPYTYL